MTVVDDLALLLKPAAGGLYLVSTGKAEQENLQRRLYGVRSAADVTQAHRAALAGLGAARIGILGIPSDVGAGFRRGANLGPQAIRQQLLDDDPSFLQACARAGIVDLGDVFTVPQLLTDEMLAEHTRARVQDAHYPGVVEADRRLLPVAPLSIAERALALAFRANPDLKPLMFGGDHSTAWPVVKALHDAGRRFCIVQVDAHTDLLKERLGVKMCFATWTYHANDLVGRDGRVIQVGIRATRFPRAHWEAELQVRQHWAVDVADDEDAALARIVADVERTGLPVYFSNDIDGTDASVADATGTPEPAGLTPAFVLRLIGALAAKVPFVGADLVEVAPVLAPDAGKKTLAAGAAYVRACIEALQAHSPVVPR